MERGPAARAVQVEGGMWKKVALGPRPAPCSVSIQAGFMEEALRRTPVDGSEGGRGSRARRSAVRPSRWTRGDASSDPLLSRAEAGGW
jgi:hypothetical protein